MAAEFPEEIELPILSADHDTIYRCPGESSPISREVHIARLDSGWSGCRDCVWNDAKVASQTAQPCKQSIDKSIRRTESGIRGPYLNAIDRFRAAQVATILASHIARVAFVRSAVHQAAAQGVSAATATAKICIGYDGRVGSQDLFAGVVSAVLQNGCDVVDAGRCTSASLLSTGRSESNIAGCLFVTGAGSRAGDVGIDVFDTDGRSLSIPWTDFGVGVRMTALEQPPQTAETQSTTKRFPTVGAINRIQARDGLNTDINDSSNNISILELPGLSDSNQLFRSGRSSGRLSSIELEETYQNWLHRWWPKAISEPVSIHTHDELVQKRVQSLTSDDTSIQFRSGDWDNTQSSRMFAFVVNEDDRHLQTYSRSGRKIPAEELANWINHSSRTTASHVTAHPTSDQQNVLLVDVASPDSGRTHEILCDALAVVGLVLTLAANPKNQFPA